MHIIQKHFEEIPVDSKLFSNPYYSKHIILCSTEERNLYRFETINMFMTYLWQVVLS